MADHELKIPANFKPGDRLIVTMAGSASGATMAADERETTFTVIRRASGGRRVIRGQRGFEDVFGNFPPIPNSPCHVVFGSGYLALKFNTGNNKASGRFIELGDSVSGFNGAPLAMAISTTPGDFTGETGVGEPLLWTTEGKSGSRALKANTAYYLNLRHINPAGGGPWSTLVEARP